MIHHVRVCLKSIWYSFIYSCTLLCIEPDNQTDQNGRSRHWRYGLRRNRSQRKPFNATQHLPQKRRNSVYAGTRL